MRGDLMTDSAQFETFLTNYQDMVYATAYRLLGQEAEAQDVAQEVFLRAWNHWPELVGSVTAGGWLKTVTRNLCLNHLERYRARWKFFSELKSADAADDDPGLEATFGSDSTVESDLLTQDQRQMLEEALARLPTDQRVALVLYHYEDLDYAEIAIRLGISLGKVKTDIHRARLALQKRLQPNREELGI
jgi:RNA polymerase sigma-70 factor (ECF subfamily)